MNGVEFNKDKFTELILYIAENADDEDFGAIKMQKALWKADFVAFARLGHSITGAEYIKLENGPAARRFPPVLQEMKEAQVAAEAYRVVNGYDSWRVVALRPADPEKFSKQELTIIQSAIAWVRSKTATTLSRESHGWAWEAVEMKEVIPYGSELFPDRPLPLSEKAIEYGRRVAERLAAPR